MKKIVFTFLSFIVTLSTVNAQKDIDFNKKRYPGGGRLLMTVDNSAKNVYYAFDLTNLPNTSVSYLPEVDSVGFQIYFRKKDSVENYRYTILADNKPIVVDKSINKGELKDIDRGDEWTRFTTLGVFPIKGK